MSNDGLKTPLADSLNALARQRARDAMVAQGRALPCRVVSRQGQIVTVAFSLQTSQTLPNVSMPIATSPYDWLPIEVGTLGLSMPSDVYLGGVSGLGGGTATTAPTGNLNALVFVPVSNSGWETTYDNYRVVQGPDGVVIQTIDGSVSLVLSSSGVTINGNLTVTGDTSFGGGAKKVVLDGDLVSGGVVVASSTTIKAS